MQPEEILGIVAGILTSSSLLPQLIKIVKEKKAEDLSLAMFLTLLTGVGLWIWYGILRNDMPIIITNSFSVLLNIITLALSLRYSSKKDAVKKLLA